MNQDRSEAHHGSGKGQQLVSPIYKSDDPRAVAAMAQDAFTANTLRALPADWRIVTAYCRTHRHAALPAVADDVRRFVFNCLSHPKKPPTIRRYVTTIGRVHRAAQDLLALNMDLSSVMQAGRLRDTRMPMRYGEKVLAVRGAMARAAKMQGRE